ncbi:MAG: nitroreductase family protein [Thermoguttaceae bacterium]|jgi:nitroreductase
MTFLELAKKRFSVRKYDDKPIEQEKIDILLQAAQAAPTGANEQPQRIYILQSPEALEKLSSLCSCVFGAKTVMLFTYNTDEEWKNPLEEGVTAGIEDVSIIATHVMLQAEELGIGSCWVNYFANSKIAEAFDIPKNERVVLLLTLGYPAADAKPSPMHLKRKDIDSYVKYL